MKARAFRFSLWLSILVLSFIAVIPAFAQQLASPILVVNTPALNLRSGPGPQYTVVVVLRGGTELPVLGTNGDNSWYLVSSPVGAGWVDIDFVVARGDFRNVPAVIVPDSVTAAPITTAFIPAAIASPTMMSARINVLAVDLRRGPFEASGVIRTLFADDNASFAVLGRTFDNRGVEWIALSVPGAGTGWVEYPKVVVSTVAPTAVGAALTSTAGIVPVPVFEPARAVVNTAFLNVRNGPGGQYAVVATLSGGTTLPVAGITSDNEWVLVRGDFGQGWLDTEFLLIRGSGSDIPILRNVY